jgi:antitoxin ParD1/3/4
MLRATGRADDGSGPLCKAIHGVLPTLTPTALPLAAATGVPAYAIPHGLPNFAKRSTIHGMSTMNISLPDSLRSFVDEQVSSRGFGTSSEYVRELIRKDQERLHLRGLLLAGAKSQPAAAADGAYFAALRERVGRRTVR